MENDYTNVGTYINSEEKSNIDYVYKNLHIGVFFDGTCNNMRNTELRKTKDDIYFDIKKKHKDSNGKIPTQRTSFENDDSNVALLFKIYKCNASTNNDIYKSFYMEGVGTEDKEADSKMQAGIGDLPGRGLRTKVDRMCKQIATFANQYINTKSTIDTINFEVFGFSRGAAAARNFVYEVTRGAYSQVIPSGMFGCTVIKHPKGGVLGKYLKEDSFKTIKIHFLGLFDTVSAYGLIHSDDVRQLNLNITYKAKRTFQIAAMDEFRKKFELTTIDSAGTKGKQLFLPGSHADIGGSYTDNMKEKIDDIIRKTPIDTKRYDKDLKYLQDEGWFANESIGYHIESMRVPASTSTYPVYVFYGERNVRKGYQTIPLAIMIKDAKDRLDGGKFVEKKLNNEDDMSRINIPFIKDIGAKLMDYYNDVSTNLSIEEAREKVRNYITWDELLSLRHKYLHISYDYVTTLGAYNPRIINKRFLREEYIG